jgi:ParB/RepB/Spo0J family partition protein
MQQPTTTPAERATHVTTLTPPDLETVQTEFPSLRVSLAELHPSPLNARTERREADVRDLANKMEAQGQLQPLIVRSRSRRLGGYEVIAGETRRQAAAVLEREGRRLGASQTVTLSVIVRDDLSDAQARAVSLVENLGRAAMHPMDTADAVHALIAHGLTEIEAAKALAVPLEEVRAVLYLAQRLADPVKDAYRQGKLTRDEARAFTLGTTKAQREALPSVLETVARGGRVSPAMIRQHFSEGKLPASRAVFDLASYAAQGGRITQALWTDEADGETSYCENRALFARLQLEAVTSKLEAIRAEGKKAELVAASEFHQYEYARAEEHDPEAVIYLIYDETTLELKVSPPAITRAQFKAREQAEERARTLETRANLERRAAQGDASAQAALAHTPSRANRPPFSGRMLERVRQERTRAMHAAAYRTNGEFALAVTILGLLRVEGVHLAPVGNTPNEGRDEATRARVLERWTGETPALRPVTAHAWRNQEGFGPLETNDPAALFAWLTDQPLESLLALLTDLTFERIGDWNEGRMHAGHAVTGLTAAFAGFLEITPSGSWALEREHLERCSRETIARWNEGAGLHVRPGETRKELIARLLEIKPRLLERGWCPPELGYDAPALPAEPVPTEVNPALSPEAAPLEAALDEEAEGDDWGEAEDDEGWQDAA